MYGQSTIKLQISKQDSQEKGGKNKRERQTKERGNQEWKLFCKIIFWSLDAITEITKHRA